MSTRLSLDTLPLEVIHHIFTFLPPPTLASLRLTGPSLHGPATSCPHWRIHTLQLLPRHIALQDIAAVPPSAWSFSLAPNGWFQAYTTLLRTAWSAWLSEQQLFNTTWTVFFKAFLRAVGQRGAGGGDLGWHALVGLKEDRTSHPLEGLPLNVSRWYVDGERRLRFSGYPPCIPSRDPHTWCRILQHVSVIMLTDAPEFLDSLVALDARIRAEYGGGDGAELAGVVAEILVAREEGFCKRLGHLQSEYNKSCGRSSGSGGSGGSGSGSCEVKETEGAMGQDEVGMGCVGSEIGQSESSGDEEESGDESSDESGDEWKAGYPHQSCPLYQRLPTELGELGDPRPELAEQQQEDK